MLLPKQKFNKMRIYYFLTALKKVSNCFSISETLGKELFSTEFSIKNYS